MLIRHLPREAATVLAQHGEDALWGLAEHLQAATVDVLRGANWQRAQAGSKSRIPPPAPTPRPGVRDKHRLGKTSMTSEQVKRWFHAMSAPKGDQDAD